MGISTDPAHQFPHQQRTLLRQIEAEDAFIRDVCNYQEPDTITSESEADLAISAMEESFLTVSYLAGQCDSQTERAEAASAFELAAAHVREPIQSCQLQLHTINNKFHQLYKEFKQLTLTAMDVQQTQYTNMLAMWTMQHCAKIVKGTAQTLDIPQDMTTSQSLSLHRKSLTNFGPSLRKW